MKKLIAFLISAICAGKAFACWYLPYEPGDQHLYLIGLEHDASQSDSYGIDNRYNRQYLSMRFDYREENLQLWRKQYPGLWHCMSDRQLEQLVYGGSDTDDDYDKAEEAMSSEAADYLRVAKRVERVRAKMEDPWYFPSKKEEAGEYTQPLETLLAQAQWGAEHQNEHGTLRGRYVLQVLRCLNTLHRTSEATEYWQQQRKGLPHDVVYNMAEREAAASLHRSGRDQEAAEIYARLGDIASLRLCRRLDIVDEMEFVYKRNPDSPYFPEEIQSLLTFYDSHPMKEIKSGYNGWPLSEYEKEKLRRGERFMRLCRRVIRERKVKNPAMWHYALAAMLDADGRPGEALTWIRKGERLCHDTFLKKSFRILRIHVEACTMPPNHAYDRQLLNDLRWLCKEADDNLPPSVREKLKEQENYHWGGNTYLWNDVMRRILLDDICPRMIKAGRTTRALQLANFADYRMFRRINKRTVAYDEWRGETWDQFSYSSDLFELTDTLRADQLATYVRWMHEGHGPMDRFLAQGSRQDSVYWFDIVGTHYLREHNYTEAAKWLSQLPQGYEKGLNVYREERGEYLRRDPFDLAFCDPNHRRSHKRTAMNSKLNFALTMALHQAAMHDESISANQRAKAKLLYAAGLRNQETYCWALTRYSDRYYSYYDFVEQDGEWQEVAGPGLETLMQKTDKMVEEALTAMTDKEMKARYLHAMHRNRDVMRLCPDSKTARQLRLQCDTWRDYACR